MIQFEPLFTKVLPVLQSKLDEIKYYEYEGITVEDIWDYCIKKKWRRKNVKELHLHEIVASIYTVKPSEIVSYFQIQQFQSDNWFSEVNQEELHELLKSKNTDNDS